MIVGIGTGGIDVADLQASLTRVVADVPWKVSVGPTSIFFDTCELKVSGFGNSCQRRVTASIIAIPLAAFEMAESLVPDEYKADARQGECMAAFIRRASERP